jgi:hypothetical protein
LTIYEGGRNMKKLLLGTILLMLAIVVPISTMAQININIGIPLPPPIVFPAAPEVMVLPETPGVYVDPDIDVDLYFWNGFWWRFWEGRWYRSHYYDRDWGYYDDVPSFYFYVDRHWRDYYRNHNWYGHQWNYQRIPYAQLHQNWQGWQKNKSWGGQKTWGVQQYPPRTQAHTQVLKQQRQQEYHQRPEVQRHQQYMQQQRQPQRSQERPGGGQGEHRK